MKSKRFLMFVPLALVLSSCNFSPKAKTETIPNNDIPAGTFIEDTKAHEELFDNASVMTSIRKSFSALESTVPAIGVQTNVDNHGTVDTEDDTISLRFVAAVAINGELGSATAIWTRAMFDTSGNAFKATATRACTTAYNALATVGSPYTIGDYNTASGGSYTHFVAYTMRNIPLNDYNNYYFTAYLTLNDGGNETVSKVVATTVDQSTQFSFNVADNGYFAVRRTSSGYETVEKGDYDDNGHYHAEFEGVQLASTDSFVVVNRDVNRFQVFGYGAAHANDPLDTEFTQVNSSQFVHARNEHRYFIFLNEYNRISLEEVFSKTLYFKPNANWIDGESRYAITLQFASESSKRVYEMSRIGETSTYTYDCYYVSEMASAPIAFYKLPLAQSNDLAGKPHTQKIGWPTGYDDMFTMNKGNDKGYWSVRTEPNYVAENGNFVITDFAEPVEIHTAQQKEYLSYNGDYSTIPEANYPGGTQHISDSLPVEVDFNFNVPGGKEIDHYSVVYGKEPDLSDGYEKAGDTTTYISFYNPYLGKNYYKLIAYFTDSSREESAIHNFYVDATNPRNLTIAGMTNCRDMGGKLLEDGGILKQGLVYRTSGSGQNGTWNTYKEAAHEEMVNHLGMRNEIYLAERDTSYNCSLEDTTVNWFYMDYSATDGSSNFSRNCEPLKKFFNFMADSNNYPVFFHCKIGTDRTGLCATMLYGLLGVSLNEIYQDYLFSNFGKIGSKRYIGEKAGHDNILRYTEYIQSFSGDTFKNKVYNALLSIGVSRDTLNAVINNLTEGPRATNNDNGQLMAFGDQLTPHNVVMSTYDNSVYSNDPAKYYTLTGPSQSVTYTFNAPRAYQGQIIAYFGNGNNSNSTNIEETIGLSLDGNGLTVRDVSYRDAGMGYINTSYSRWMYYPVILGIADLSAGEHTIEINGRVGDVNIAGITVLNASTAVDLGGGDLSGEDPKHLHSYGDWNYTIAPTCEHAGERTRTCSCGRTQTERVAKLSHSYGEPVISYSAGINQGVSYPATTGYNCSAGCNKGALRWSALDYDETLSDYSLNISGDRIRFSSGNVENKDGYPVVGSHIVYKINVTESVANAGLAFRIQNTNGNSGTAPIFNTIPNDSAVGYVDDGNGNYTASTKRYGLRVNGIEYSLDDDDYGDQAGVQGWFDWPVSFPIQTGINTIDVFAYGGYRAYIYEFQLTGFTRFVNNHQHQLGEWHHDEYSHWKECEAEGCPSSQGTRFNEAEHSFGEVHVDDEPTCTANGHGTQTCSCGYVRDVSIPALGHDWVDNGVITEATCLAEGEMATRCSRCGSIGSRVISKLSHNYSEETVIPAGDVDQVAYYSSTCSVGHETKLRISAMDGTLAEGSSIKDGTPSGFVKLTSTGNSISYTFNYTGTTTEAKIYQRAIFDSWTSSNVRVFSYSTQGTGNQGCNFSLVYNGDEVDMSATKTVQYQTMLNGGVDTGLGSSYSYMDDCLIGTIELRNGINSFTYTRLASMNLLVHDYIIVIEP